MSLATGSSPALAPAPENLAQHWARLLVEGLAAAGVMDVVVCPGSRSTPIVLAADACARVRVHDLIDERSAAFFALGQARVTGRPTAVVYTSGTAGAHAYPAVIEAEHAHLPLLVVTANRPPELWACDAAQTIDQARLFGAHARAFVLGAPEAHAGALASVGRVAAQAVAAALAPTPGPVHLDVPLRKPLEPVPATPAGAPLSALVERLVRGPAVEIAPAHLAPDPTALGQLARLLARAERGLLVAGPLPAAEVSHRAALLSLARAGDLAVCAEAGSQLRFSGAPEPLRCDAFDALFRSAVLRARLRPDVILQLGGTPLSTGYEALLAEHPGVPRVVVSPHAFADPYGSPALHVRCAPAAIARALSLPARPEGPCARWLAALSARVLAAAAGIAEAAFGEAAVARLALAAAPAGSLFQLGNSLPIRTVEAFGDGASADVTVLCQRGANGIDGLVSSAAGAALAARSPTTLLVGDVTFLHDLGGLLAARAVDLPLVVVVVQNDGGRIFDALPLGRVPGLGAARERHFVMPPRVDLGACVTGFGVEFAKADTSVALAAALARAHAHPGCTVIEAVVPPDAACRERAALDAATADLIEGDPT